jgi:hypothetical protein
MNFERKNKLLHAGVYQLQWDIIEQQAQLYLHNCTTDEPD